MTHRERREFAPVDEYELPHSPKRDTKEEIGRRSEAVVQVAPQPIPGPATPEIDDLRQIEGIGPKVAGLLQEAGITSFGQLARSSEEQLREILKGAGLAMMNPSTWPEQARLAAAGDHEALKALQERLKGGRRG